MERAALVLAGRGFYSIPEASRLTELSVATIRRYSLGYDFKSGGEKRHSPAAFQADMVAEAAGPGPQMLSFLDLIELRMVKLFRMQRVSGPEIRQAQKTAMKWLDSQHPFATGKFKTFGRKILMEAGKGEEGSRLVEIARSQTLMSEIIQPFTREVKFEGDTPVLWTHPRGLGIVVLDPHRSFGHPIVKYSSVPSTILAEAAASWGPPEEVARWYDVQLEEVKAALAFERRRAA